MELSTKIPKHIRSTAIKLSNELGKKDRLKPVELAIRVQEVFDTPEAHLNGHFDELAEQLIAYKNGTAISIGEEKHYTLLPEVQSYEMYGKENIEIGAIDQMNVAMQLPITIAGALMPDAHQGYGLPIGGVLATEADKIIPYAVGVDIACRMCLSIFAVEGAWLETNRDYLQKVLVDSTTFGTGGETNNPLSDDLWDHPNWKATNLIKSLRERAGKQIGTSGTGNHFVEFGLLVIEKEDKDLNLPAGEYVALLSHSGSRGFGANIANYYTKLAKEQTKLPKEAQALAWLDLNTEAGQEYWISMNLAGDYASACHHQIHRKVAKALGWEPVQMIENHHNFAWEETLPDGRKAMVHRKGATPASIGEIGIIPGSMIHPGFVVRGMGNVSALQSASHGAGRRMSRTAALQSVTQSDLQTLLKKHNIDLIGGDLDEAPMVYKDIEQVMAFQSDLVETLAKFVPKIVRMADKEEKRKYGKKISTLGE